MYVGHNVLQKKLSSVKFTTNNFSLYMSNNFGNITIRLSCSMLAIGKTLVKIVELHTRIKNIIHSYQVIGVEEGLDVDMYKNAYRWNSTCN